MNVFDEAYHSRALLFGTDPTEELMYVVDKFNITGIALELGCGDGRDTKHILDHGFSVYAIDQSKWALHNLYNRTDISYEQKSRLNLINSNVLYCEYGTEKYDFIYAITLFDHIDEQSSYELLYKLLVSLKEGGYLFLKVHSVDDVGNTNATKEVSEFSSEIKHYYEPNELLEKLIGFGRVLYYLNSIEEDNDHGPIHTHSFISILLKKESKNEN